MVIFKGSSPSGTQIVCRDIVYCMTHQSSDYFVELVNYTLFNFVADCALYRVLILLIIPLIVSFFPLQHFEARLAFRIVTNLPVGRDFYLRAFSINGA